MILLTILFLIIDIISKAIISIFLNIYDSIVIIKNFFNLTYVKNTGAAFSVFSGARIFLIIISLCIILFFSLYINKNKPKNKLEKLSYAMILGGAIGNFLDRFFLGYVIDFLDFNLFGYDYPIFNLADSFIFLGVLFLLIDSWRRDGWNLFQKKKI